MNKEYRRGATLIIALFILSITCLFMADQARVLLLRMKLNRLQRNEMQALLLEKAALERATLQAKQNPAYEGETWLPAIEQLPPDQVWEVTILPTESDNTPSRWDCVASLRENAID